MRKHYEETCPRCGKSPIRRKNRMWMGRAGHPPFRKAYNRCMTCLKEVK